MILKKDKYYIRNLHSMTFTVFKTYICYFNTLSGKKKKKKFRNLTSFKTIFL